MSLTDRAKSFVAAIERGAPQEEIETFFAPDIIQREFPNALLPTGATRDLAAMREANARGRGVMRAQSYAIDNVICQGNRVVLETVWTGTLAVAFDKLRPGDTMRAHFAQIFEFEGELIRRIRNYDCFDPF